MLTYQFFLTSIRQLFIFRLHKQTFFLHVHFTRFLSSTHLLNLSKNNHDNMHLCLLCPLFKIQTWNEKSDWLCQQIKIDRIKNRNQLFFFSFKIFTHALLIFAAKLTGYQIHSLFLIRIWDFFLCLSLFILSQKSQKTINKTWKINFFLHQKKPSHLDVIWYKSKAKNKTKFKTRHIQHKKNAHKHSIN